MTDAMTLDFEPAATAKRRKLKLLVVAFSARNAIEQTLDELVYGLMPVADCRVMVPTNYHGGLPESALLRVELGVSLRGGMLACVSPRAHWQVMAHIRRFRPDVIHLLSGEGYPWAASMTAAAALCRIPLVMTMNDPDPHPGNVFERLNALLRKPVLARTIVFHLYSDHHLHRMHQLAPHARAVIIPHGSLARRYLEYRTDDIEREKLVLFFGRIQHYKGIDTLCQAMQLLPADTRLAIAGPGTLGPEDKTLIARLGDRVELHNSYVGDADVARLMQRASVVALPYRHATQSSVPGIATAFGVPLVASALGHFIQEVPALGGLLAPPEDPAALAAALRRALDGELRPGTPAPSFRELAPDYLAAYAAAGARVS